jgi:hypothetical protein
LARDLYPTLGPQVASLIHAGRYPEAAALNAIHRETVSEGSVPLTAQETDRIFAHLLKNERRLSEHLGEQGSGDR